tara:strand:+ start:5943 stop:6683 length:741 start_codon:yes stop_codon:yes gene_type:complete
MKKIFIFGFPHSGTTILQTIFSHVDSVYSNNDESMKIDAKTIDKFEKTKKSDIVIKYPYYDDSWIESEEYGDYHKIFIMRNPYWLYSSLHRRAQLDFGKKPDAYNNKHWNDVSRAYVISPKHSIENWERVSKKWLEYRNNPVDKVYCIKYEDLFENNYQNLKDILDKIGLEYTDDIFDNTKYKNTYKNMRRVNCLHRYEHLKLRNKQINEPFKNMNLPKKITLTDKQKAEVSKISTLKDMGYDIIE